MKYRLEKYIDEWSVLLFDAITIEAAKIPFIMRLILLVDTFYNVTFQKIYNRLLASDKDKQVKKWAEISGSYAEGTCIAGSDIDFVQPSIAMVHAYPQHIPPWHRYVWQAILLFIMECRYLI